MWAVDLVLRGSIVSVQFELGRKDPNCRYFCSDAQCGGSISIVEYYGSEGVPMPEFLKGLGFMQLIDPGGSWGLISFRNDFFFFIL